MATPAGLPGMVDCWGHYGPCGVSAWSSRRLFFNALTANPLGKWCGRAERVFSRCLGRRVAWTLSARIFTRGRTSRTWIFVALPQCKHKAAAAFGAFGICSGYGWPGICSRRINPSQFRGDFIYVASAADRTSLTTISSSGGCDNGEEQRFWRILGRRFQLQEMFQPEVAHVGATSRARLDRFYCNQGISEQLDRRIGCTALEWRHDLSHRRAIISGDRRHKGSIPDHGPSRRRRWSTKIFRGWLL